MGYRLLVVMSQVVLGNLVGGGLPYPIVGHDIVQHLGQVLCPMGAAHDIWVEGNAHQPAVLLTLAVELVKLGFTDLGIVVGLVVMPHQGGVIQFGGIGDTDQLPVLTLMGRG